MSSTHEIIVECREAPIQRVVVFNDRAEVKRLVKAELVPGTNEVYIKNISQNTVYDSVRVDGRGDAIIHEVSLQDKPGIVSEVDSPKVAELRSKFQGKEEEVNEIKDRQTLLQKKIDALDKAVTDIGSNNGKEGTVRIDDDVLAGFDKFYDYYENNSAKIRSNLRKCRSELKKAEEELQKLQNELNIAEINDRQNVFCKNVVILLESKAGGAIELDIVYQVFNANWNPSYDIRVDVGEKGAKNHVKISYYGKVYQQTGEDWNDVNLVLSTAQPCLGGHIPELGTLEAVFYRPPPPPQMARSLGALKMMKCAGTMNSGAPELECAAAPMMMDYAQTIVQEQTLSTEFAIARLATIPSNPDFHKVTIGIIDLIPKLVHECVPSRNPSVFLTASAINESQLPILAGEASVFLNNAFVAKTNLKNVSPNERFTCSLGVDASVRVEYRPAKKYHEQVGLINKSSSAITEQVINVKNTRSAPILITIREHIPRSTDEKIKIRVINPTITSHEETPDSVSETANIRAGVKLNNRHNLEWTVELNAGQQQDLTLKWAMEHPKDEKIEFQEKF